MTNLLTVSAVPFGWQDVAGDRVTQECLRQQDFVVAATVDASPISQGIEDALALAKHDDTRVHRWHTADANLIATSRSTVDIDCFIADSFGYAVNFAHMLESHVVPLVHCSLM